MTFELRPSCTKTLLLTGVIALSMAGVSGSSLAQTGGAQPTPAVQLPKETVQKLKAKQMEIQQLTSQLREVEKKATAADPTLQDKQEKYRDLVMRTMKDEGFDPKAAMERMRALQAELQGGTDLDTQQRQQKMQTLGQRRREFHQRQQQAMQVDEVKTAREALSEDIKSAMEEQDPRFQDEVAQLNQLRQEYRALLRQALMQRQGDGQTPQG